MVPAIGDNENSKPVTSGHDANNRKINSAPRAEAVTRAGIRCARISIDFFVLATVSLAGGIAAAPWVVGALAGYFYQLSVLALVHTFALGWITAVIIGVMYRYVPALTHGTLPYPRLLMPQFVLYVVGVSGMVSHFALGSWSGVWSAAIVVIASIVLFAANIVPLLRPQVGRGVAESGMFIALCFLIIAAALGFLLAFDKSRGFLGGSLISNLASHAHLAALGWVTLTICAVSYRMVPALILPGITLPNSASWQLCGLAFGVVGLAVSLLIRAPGIALWGMAIAAALIAYVITIVRLVWTHRRPIDWSIRHAIAGIGWLIVAVVMGIVLALTGAENEFGARLAAAYGVLGIFGWMGNFIIGISYYLFPGSVIRVRAVRGWHAMTHAALSVPTPRAFIFVAFNAGLAILVAGLLDANVTICIVATTIIAAGVLSYSAATTWTLSFAYCSRKTVT
jgi:cbb3-type cytochrome oxidase subunit 1